MKPPFLKALPLLNKIEEAGFEAYFVGGSVRDFLLGRPIDDVDIATSATPQEIQGVFSRTVDVGIKHGTVVVLFDGESYEVTTFRSESEYDDFRRPNEVHFIRSLKEDLRRRDFTMNAIAMDKDGQIIDPFRGQEALKRKVIETVGLAEERFREDALRMMRAVRFVSQLSFSLDAGTFAALSEHGRLLEHIAVERKAVEFEKLLVGGNSREALDILLETGIYQYLPGFSAQYEALFAFKKRGIEPSLSVEEIWVLLLTDFQIEQEDVETLLRSWKQPIKKIKRVQSGLYWLKMRLNEPWTIDQLYYAKEELVISTEKLYNYWVGNEMTEQLVSLKQQLAFLPIKSRNELDVSGQNLMEWYNLKGGPWIENKLREIERAVIRKEIENRNESIREWLFSCNQP